MLGLVLAGGGARGAYQIGAWKALREKGYKFDYVAGTSVGALNGALVAQNDFHKAYDLWYNLKPSDVIEGDDELLEKLINLDVRTEDFKDILGFLKSIIGKMGLDISPLKKLLDDNIDEERIRKSKTILGIVTVSLTDFKPIEVFIDEIESGMLKEYLIASANLPIFDLERVNEKLYIDGGFYDNVPISLLKSKGIKDLIVVDLEAIGIKRRVDKQDLNITTISPSKDIGNILEFTTDNARRNLKLGYLDAMRVVGDLYGREYFIKGRRIKDDILFNIDIKDIESINSYFEFKNYDNKRYFYEKLIPKIFEIYKLSHNSSYEDLVISILENVANQLDIDQLNIYTLKTLLKAIEIKIDYYEFDTIRFHKGHLMRFHKEEVSKLLYSYFRKYL